MPTKYYRHPRIFRPSYGPDMYFKYFLKIGRDIETGGTKTFSLNLQIQRSLVFQTLQVYKSRLSSNLNKKRAKFCKSLLRNC